MSDGSESILPASTESESSDWSSAWFTPTVAAALFYGLSRYSYQAFYERLGVSPEDVGRSWLDVLSQSAVGIGILAIALVGILALSVDATAVCLGAALKIWEEFPAWRISFRQHVDPVVRRADAIRIVFVIVVLVDGAMRYGPFHPVGRSIPDLVALPFALVLIWWGLAHFVATFAALCRRAVRRLIRVVIALIVGKSTDGSDTNAPQRRRSLFAISAVLQGLLVVPVWYCLGYIIPGDLAFYLAFYLAIAAFVLLWRWSKEVTSTGKWEKRGRKVVWHSDSFFLPATVVVLSIVLFEGVPELAQSAARCAASGGRVETVRSPRALPILGRVSYLGITAEPVAVRWLVHVASTPQLSSQVAYLGENGGMELLYDAKVDHVVRLPQQDIALTALRGTRRC